MNPVRKRKLLGVLFVTLLLSAATLLVLYALRQNISLFYTPTEVADKKAPVQQAIRVGGMVVKGSVKRDTKDLSVRFQVTDFNKSLWIHYRGILPDLFREGQGIVALGMLSEQGYFQADEVLAKHDENYMPPEVRDSLAKQ